MIHRKLLPELATIDWARAEVVLEPEGARPGFWVGACDVLHVPEEACFYLAYRVRRPIDASDPHQRGSRWRIARSDDGVCIEDVTEIHATDLGSVSIEKGCLARGPDGRCRAYLSYEYRTGYKSVCIVTDLYPVRRFPCAAAGVARSSYW